MFPSEGVSDWPMLKQWMSRGFGHLCCLYGSLLVTCLTGANNLTEHTPPGRPLCQPGYFCPEGMSSTPIPCPKGTYGPTAGATSIGSCISCPPHQYCPKPGLSASLPCGPDAQQPLSHQDTCVCLGEGQTFQMSDGQCQCALGYQRTSKGDRLCAQTLYDVCRDGKTRTQYGDCLDRHQWALHCRQKVCQSAEDYQRYDAELGLCVCRQSFGRADCGSLCRSSPPDEALMLQCHLNGDMELLWRHGGREASGVSGGELESVFKRRGSLGSPPCDTDRLNSSHPVYAVQTTAAGFIGLLTGHLPEEVRKLFPVSAAEQGAHSSADDNFEALSDGPSEDHVAPAWNSSGLGGGQRSASGGRGRGGGGGERESRVFGVLNPTACLHLGDILLFTVSKHHYPQYDIENLYNTNSEYDWGAFRQLLEELTLSWSPPSLFSLLLTQPGVYVLSLNSHQYKHMYVRVMPAGGQCYETGPFFPTLPRHMTRVGIARRRNLLLRPDWMVTGGLIFGAVVILCTCMTLLILFREYGWPDKEPIRARYRALQSGYRMDDYSSKGLRMTSVMRTHRNLQARMTRDSMEPDTMQEFWDYELQVDLEAFSTSTFYSLLLRHSLSVTTRLGQLTTEVKELHQGVLGKLRVIHSLWAVEEEKGGHGYDTLRREVEREVGRRRATALQLRALLGTQLQVLRRELQAQQGADGTFMSHLRECTRLLTQAHNNQQQHQPLWEQHQQTVAQRVSSLAAEMGEQVSCECQRQGAWGVLGEGTGAQLLCPDTGTILVKEDIVGPDGSLRACGAVHSDGVTGLVRPNAHSHMLLSSGHTMPVPPDFFLHPQTGRVMPIAGNVAYDPVTSTLVFTTDSCTGDSRKWDSPLLPFVPYPVSRRSDQPLPATRLRGLRPGQRLQLGAPMADPDTGVPVPILAVTIHPQTGLVYPLGGVHVCPLTGLRQPVQMGSPMLDPRTGALALITGVSLDPVTGATLPVGGVLLSESFVEPLSGRMVRVGGASMRAGQVVPHAGGYQALLDNKVLSARVKVVELLRALTEDWSPAEAGVQQQQQQPVSAQHHGQGSERGSGLHHGRLQAVTKELQLASGRSSHCLLQMNTRLELLVDWASAFQQDGGTLGELPLPGSDVCMPALLGMDYPDPMGSGLSVPVLGTQMDPISGTPVLLAGTMEDPDGKGLVAIRCGSLTVDPVTGVLAPVVGARLDVSTKTVVAVTASYWLALAEHTDSVQAEALQREVCRRNSYWQQQRQKEEEMLGDLDSSLMHCVCTVTTNSDQVQQWSEAARQLRESVEEQQYSAQREAQRRAAQRAHLGLLLPPHVLRVLSQGDEEEWEQQCVWHAELGSRLDRVDVCMDQLQQDQEKWSLQGGQQTAVLHTVDRELRQKELWKLCCSIQAELDKALAALHFTRHLSQLRADTAQAVLSGNFWYRDYGLCLHLGARPGVNAVGLVQQKALPLLERLSQLLEDRHPASLSPSACHQHLSGTTAPHHTDGLSVKQIYGLETCSRVWTASMPVVKGISSQSLRETVKAPSQDAALPESSPPTHSSQRDTTTTTTSSGIHSQESHMKECLQPTHICVPTISEEEWDKLLELSPLFQLLKGVELQLKGRAREAGLLRGEQSDRGNGFIDVLDAQWECEGELIPLDPSILNPREFLVYQHGLFLINTLHSLQMAPAISLHIAGGLPANNYLNNAFRNSFFYQEAEEMLFVRRQRLQSVGGFSLVLVHCLSHLTLGDMRSDSNPAFQRVFFKILQACLGELFQARLAVLSPGQDAKLGVPLPGRGGPSLDSYGTQSGSLDTSLLDRLLRPNKALLSHEDVEGVQKKHSATYLFSSVEGLLREKSSGVTHTNLME